ncbi:MAG: LamG domain-containing protein [Spirochaetales bacterium]|nr:LamG domain-containing protein [Spirochaetales bacterium]
MLNKKISFLVIIVSILEVFFFSSCDSSITLGDMDIDDSRTANLSVSLSTDLSRTITPSIDLTIISFNIAGSGPGGVTFSSEDVSGTSFTAENIITGTWTIMITAKNIDGTDIMTGFVVTEIVSGENSVNVDVYLLTDVGNFDLSLQWPLGILNEANLSVVSSFTKVGDNPIVLTVTETDGSASCIQDFPAGYYLWNLQIEESGDLRYRIPPEVVRIVTGETTEHVIDLNSILVIEPVDDIVTGDSTPLLNWFDFPDAVSYRIQISEIENDFSSSPEISVTNSEFQIIDELSIGLKYWRVRPVYESSVEGEWGSTWSFNYDYSIPTDGLVAEYLFDVGDASDTSGNSKNGTISGAVSCEDHSGNAGKAMQLDGINDVITTPLIYSGDQDPISLAGWVNLESDSVGYLYGEYTTASDTRNLFMIIMSSQVLGFDQYTPSGGNALSAANTNILPSTWLFFTITKEANVVKFYLNGQLYDQKTHTETYSGSASAVAGIGDRYGSGGWEFNSSTYNLNGKVDDFRFYNRALTAEEITNLYNN